MRISDWSSDVCSSDLVWMKNGRIHRVGPTTELKDGPADIPRRSLAGHIVMPGLVNCHTHLGNGFLRGIYDEMPLEVWFSKGMWPVLAAMRSEENTSELQSLMRISYAVFCLKKTKVSHYESHMSIPHETLYTTTRI